jgi:3-phosphoshikimate 1-carboxyvinyltransferase
VTTLVVHPAETPLRGSVAAPPDADTVTLAALLAAHASGPCAIGARGLPELPVLGALTSLGLGVARDDAGLHIDPGAGLRVASGPLHCGRSAVTMAGLAAVLAARPFVSVLDGDEAMARACMGQVARALRRRGAQIEGRLDPRRPGELAPPIEVGPAVAPLAELSLDVAPGDWAGKQTALLSGLAAAGPTFVAEPIVVTGRAERLLAALGAGIDGAGPALRLEPLGPGGLAAFAGEVAGDGELALVLVAAALAVPRSLVGVRAVGTSAGRAGWVEALRDAGAALALEPRAPRLGDAVSDIHASAAELGPLAIGGERALRAGAGLAALAAVAAHARGESRLDGAEPAVLAMLRGFGVDAADDRGTLVVAGRAGPLRPSRVLAGGDALLAMSATALALAADAPSRIEQAGSIISRYPRFVATLRALGARIDVLS